MQCTNNFFITIWQHLIHLLIFEISQKLDPSKKRWVWPYTVNNSENNNLKYLNHRIVLVKSFKKKYNLLLFNAKTSTRNKQACLRECQRAPRFPLSQTHPLSPCTAKPSRGGGGVTEKNRNLKAAKIFCKTPLHREMNKEYKELFLDFSMNK